MTAILIISLLLACGDKDTDSGATGGNTETTDDGSSDGGSTAQDGGTADGGTADGGAAAKIHEIDPDTLAGWLDDGTELLLINTHVPYDGEIPGTDVHIAYTDGAELIAAVGDDLDRLTVVYCKTGPMSETAAETLVDAGYRAIYDLPAGMSGWQSAGYELSE